MLVETPISKDSWKSKQIRDSQKVPKFVQVQIQKCIFNQKNLPMY